MSVLGKQYDKFNTATPGDYLLRSISRIWMDRCAPNRLKFLKQFSSNTKNFQFIISNAAPLHYNVFNSLVQFFDICHMLIESLELVLDEINPIGDIVHYIFRNNNDNNNYDDIIAMHELTQDLMDNQVSIQEFLRKHFRLELIFGKQIQPTEISTSIFVHAPSISTLDLQIGDYTTFDKFFDNEKLVIIFGLHEQTRQDWLRPIVNIELHVDYNKEKLENCLRKLATNTRLNTAMMISIEMSNSRFFQKLKPEQIKSICENDLVDIIWTCLNYFEKLQQITLTWNEKVVKHENENVNVIQLNNSKVDANDVKASIATIIHHDWDLQSLDFETTAQVFDIKHNYRM